MVTGKGCARKGRNTRRARGAERSVRVVRILVALAVHGDAAQAEPCMRAHGVAESAREYAVRCRVPATHLRPAAPRTSKGRLPTQCVNMRPMSAIAPEGGSRRSGPSTPHLGRPSRRWCTESPTAGVRPARFHRRGSSAHAPRPPSPFGRHVSGVGALACACPSTPCLTCGTGDVRRAAVILFE